MSEEAKPAEPDNDRTQFLQAVVNTNTSSHVLMNLTDEEVLMVSLQTGFNACLHGFNNDVKAAADHLEEMAGAMMRRVRHQQATSLVLPPGMVQ